MFLPPEALKADPATSARMMQGLLQDIWEKEEIPTEWKTGHIVKFLRKETGETPIIGEVSNFCQYPAGPRDNTTRETERAAVNNTLRDEQAGFRAGISCIDQVATLCIILEQSLEWQSPVSSFIDFKKAADMIDRSTMRRIMRHYGITLKIVSIIRNLLLLLEKKPRHRTSHI